MTRVLCWACGQDHDDDVPGRCWDATPVEEPVDARDVALDPFGPWGAP